MLSTLVFFQTLRARIEDAAEEGQGLAEYGLILALVAVACVAALTGLAGKITATLASVGSHL